MTQYELTYNALTGGRRVVTTAGTAVQLSTTSTICQLVQITALVTNTAVVFVGGSDVLTTVGSENGTPLNPGDTWEAPMQNLTQVYLDARVSGEGVSYLFFR